MQTILKITATLLTIAVMTAQVFAQDKIYVSPNDTDIITGVDRFDIFPTNNICYTGTVRYVFSKSAFDYENEKWFPGEDIEWGVSIASEYQLLLIEYKNHGKIHTLIVVGELGECLHFEAITDTVEITAFDLLKQQGIYRMEQRLARYVVYRITH